MSVVTLLLPDKQLLIQIIFVFQVFKTWQKCDIMRRKKFKENKSTTLQNFHLKSLFSFASYYLNTLKRFMKTVNYLIKNKRILGLLAMLSIVLVCCKSLTPTNKATSSKPSLVPDSADLAVAQTHWKSVTLPHLTDGYNLFTTKCTECHGIKLPQDFSVNDWNDILPQMGKKAGLDSTQYTSVYQYILAKRESVLSGKK